MKRFILAACVASVACISFADDGWVCLSDSLDGWTQKGNWELKDGVIHRTGKGGSLDTKKLYENFILEFEWKISEKGNSGVKYRMKKIGRQMLGLEYQVIDDTSQAATKPFHTAGSIYDLVPASPERKLNPPGQWNKGRIVANGPVLEHWLNGKKVAGIDQSTDAWKTCFAKSKFRKAEGFGFGKGVLHLQDHGNEVWFRNIRVKELK